MGQITYRANLSAKSFPFLAQDWGRTVIVPQYDNTFNRQVSSAEDPDRDVGIPQLYYCENVMPFAQGLQSIGYSQVIPAVTTLPIPYFGAVHNILEDTGQRTLLGITRLGYLYVIQNGVWTFKGSFGEPDSITVAYISGRTYIFSRALDCRRYDFTSQEFVRVNLSGLNIGDIIGITSSSGYMIAWGSNKIFWSSTLGIDADTVDFIPSLVTGAGSQSIEAARGSIVFCAPHILGFIIYCDNNIIASLYSNNPRYPFNFREIPGSGGLSSKDLVTYDANSASQYAYTTSGLQSISTTSANTIFPELTDFISGRLLEEFDSVNNQFIYTDLNEPLFKKLSIVADRYLIISYGPYSIYTLTYALVYDTSLKRWGKLSIAHSQIFEYSFPNSHLDIPKQSIGVLDASGKVSIVNFSKAAPDSYGVAIFGKYQFVRARLLQLDAVTVENIRPDPDVEFFDMPALDGSNMTIQYPSTPTYSNALTRTYYFRALGTNHSLCFKGRFEIVSLVLIFNIDGKR